MTPIWKKTLTAFELRNIQQSLNIEDGSQVQFLAPRGLDAAFYQRQFPGVDIRRVPDECMQSVGNYNTLVSQPDFYEAYLDFDFLTIVQTDALLIRGLECLDMDSLDYLGAPWICGLQYLQIGNRLIVDERCPRIPISLTALVIRVGGRRVWVGNGGLSVRRVEAFIDVTRRLRSRMSAYLRQGLNEDVIFSTAGVDAGLRVPSAEYAGSIFREHVTIEQAKALELVGVHAPAPAPESGVSALHC